MERSNARGLDRREATLISYPSIDEKSFGKGHDLVAVLADLDGSRVVDVAPEHI